ncbi:hypothetical protein DPMN_100222 [Dreissena polymorpha]|uniref:Uncharacterized protein n=1 Tax=Dreissena polymorpha TaxID=45954 RepID=A0A9D4R768_DREPO|nr:hypothetical protein DPMN_100222 [Dreissena polymorpha]
MISGLLGLLSINSLPKTITPMTTRHPHGPTRQQHAINRARSRRLSWTVPQELLTYTAETLINTDQHGIHTEHIQHTGQRHGLTQHSYGPNMICMSFDDSIILQSNLESVTSFTYLNIKMPP